MRIAHTIALLLIASVSTNTYAQVEYSNLVSDIPEESCFDQGCFSAPQPARPKLVVSFDFLILDRHDSISGPYFFDNVTFQPLLNIDQLTGDAEPGVRVGFTAIEDDCHATELVFFGVDQYGGRQTANSPNAIFFPFFGGTAANPLTQYDLKYTSEFHGVELNRRRVLSDRITGLYGIRFIELREEFTVNGAGGRFFSLTDNDLYGFQLGGEIRLFDWGRTRFVSTVKGGVYYDNADITAEAINPATNGLLKFVDDEDEIAFVGELMIGALVPMGPQANLRFGYQMFYLDGIGLGPNQSATYSLFSGQGSMDQTDIWYHGAYFGLELFW